MVVEEEEAAAVVGKSLGGESTGESDTQDRVDPVGLLPVDVEAPRLLSELVRADKTLPTVGSPPLPSPLTPRARIWVHDCLLVSSPRGCCWPVGVGGCCCAALPTVT